MRISDEELIQLYASFLILATAETDADVFAISIDEIADDYFEGNSQVRLLVKFEEQSLYISKFYPKYIWEKMLLTFTGAIVSIANSENGDDVDVQAVLPLMQSVVAFRKTIINIATGKNANKAALYNYSIGELTTNWLGLIGDIEDAE